MVRFSKASESNITSAIFEDFKSLLSEAVDSDVIVVGSGPSGLMVAKRLAESGVKTLIVEKNNYLGGSFWTGGFMMNVVTFRDPAQRILGEIGVPYKEVAAGIFTASGPYACSKLVASVCDAGVKILTMVSFEDIVIRENNRIAGIAMNWSAVSFLPLEVKCLCPIALESKVVIDASGISACVCRKLSERNMLDMKDKGAIWVEKAEDLIVENTSEVSPGLVVCGMAVSSVYGIETMGPSFGAMLYSGIKAADEAKRMLSSFEVNASE